MRQADLAAAATAAGLGWGRSSIAALENGSRNIGVEELALLPFLISNAGGWDKEIIRPSDKIRVSSTHHMTGATFRDYVGKLFAPVGEEPGTRVHQRVKIPLGEVEESWMERATVKSAFDPELERARSAAITIAWFRALAALRPKDDRAAAFTRVHSGGDYELRRRVRERIPAMNIPDEVAEYDVLQWLAYFIWGSTFEDERDRRANERISETDRDVSRRGIQAVRGHVTREMIEELLAGAKQLKAPIEEAFAPVVKLWDDGPALGLWAKRSTITLSR